jgi:hypothetical protein
MSEIEKKSDNQADLSRQAFFQTLAIYESNPDSKLGKKLFAELCRLVKSLKDVTLAGKVYYATPPDSLEEIKASALWLSFW